MPTGTGKVMVPLLDKRLLDNSQSMLFLDWTADDTINAG